MPKNTPIFLLALLVMLPLMASEPASAQASARIIVSCSNPGTSWSDLPIPPGVYTVTITGACEYAATSTAIGDIGGVVPVPRSACTVSVQVYKADCNPHYLGNFAPCATGRHVVLVAGQCFGAVGTLNWGGGFVPATFSDGTTHYDNVGYFVVTLTH